jgi:hypothetical protein
MIRLLLGTQERQPCPGAEARKIVRGKENGIVIHTTLQGDYNVGEDYISGSKKRRKRRSDEQRG